MNAERLPSPSPFRLHGGLFLSSAAAAIACALLAPQRAEAQAFKGGAVATFGTVTRTITGPTTETIQIETPSAVLDWKPLDGAIGGPPIDFLPAGNVATFQNGINVTDFMVLNRIVPNDPSRAIALNGTIISQLQTAGGTVRGGTVAFYSPGGILIGPKAVIDVGNLLLTTISPALDGAGNFFVGNTYALTGAVSPKSSITVSAGAQISALNNGSYIAMASPVIQQHGIVKADGSIAYVAAESLSLKINSGLFDIVVKTGSSSGTNTLVHDGTTGGPSSTGLGDNQRIYMVAVPKNQAITALLQGNVGFDAASSAAISNGEIILSAGRDVVADALVPNNNSPAGASFLIQGGGFTSDVVGSARTDFIVDSSNGDTGFTGNVALQGDARAHVEAPAGRSVTIAGNLVLRSDQDFTAGGGLDAQGGEAAILANGGTVKIGGNVLLSAVGVGGFDTASSTAGAGVGGTAEIKLSGGGVDIGGSLTAAASGTAGDNAAPATNGAVGTGGNALVSAAGGTVRIGGATSLTADGIASRIAGGGAVTAATGTGGIASVTADAGGTIIATGLASLSSRGRGGAIAGFGGTGGTGQGGSSNVVANGGSISLLAGGQLDSRRAPAASGAMATAARALAAASRSRRTAGSVDFRRARSACSPTGQGGDSGAGTGGAGRRRQRAASVAAVAHSGASQSRSAARPSRSRSRGSAAAAAPAASASMAAMAAAAPAAPARSSPRRAMACCNLAP